MTLENVFVGIVFMGIVAVAFMIARAFVGRE